MRWQARGFEGVVLQGGVLLEGGDAARRSALPATDPAERGGATGGSSNASRTQSTAPGAAATSRDGAEWQGGQLFDSRNWAGLYGMRLP